MVEDRRCRLHRHRLRPGGRRPVATKCQARQPPRAAARAAGSSGGPVQRVSLVGIGGYCARVAGVFMTGRSGTGTSLAADRRARQPSRGHRLAGLERGRPAGRRVRTQALDRGAHPGPPQGHQQGDAVRRGMHLEPLEVLRPIRRDRAPGRADRGDSRPCRECDNNPYVKSESERAQIIESATWSSRSSPVRLPTRSTPRVPPTTWSRCSRPSLAVDAGPDGPPPPPIPGTGTGMGEG